jgi:hypothetical protein
MKKQLPTLLALTLVVVALAIPGCRRDCRNHVHGRDCPTVEHGDPRKGPGPKNCPCEGR